ncbi:hypothetical protein [Corynebacterium sp. A21]|uniref:hypothetical protein n=1 Tax=Corynebacterium sp. A21 TaxID=3457318 RepID=UPI003FCF9458
MRLQSPRTAFGNAMFAALTEMGAKAAFDTADTVGEIWREFRQELVAIQEQGFVEEVEMSAMGTAVSRWRCGRGGFKGVE